MMDKELINQRLSKARFVGQLLVKLPFVRCVILNGSLASGKSKKSSDIDILIIAKNGRIFTARFFVNLFTSIVRIKRSKDESKSHAGKFCFNYFLTENFLKIPIGRGEKIDKYCAENYSASKFVTGDRLLFEEFILANQELFRKYGCKITKSKLSASARQGQDGQISNKNSNYKIKSGTTSPQYNPEPPQLSSPRKRGSRKLLYRFWISSLQSRMTACGDWFEQVVRRYQIKKIESDSRTKRYPELIVYNDNELRFHPPSRRL